MDEENENISQTYIPTQKRSIYLLWIPILITILLLTMIIVNYCLCGSADNWPTISSSARDFPMSRIFAVLSSVAGFLLFFYANLIIDHLGLNGLDNYKCYRVVPISSTISFISMSCCGIGDQSTVHGVFAGLGFGSLLLFSILVFFVHLKKSIIKLKILKIVIQAMAIVLTLPLLVLTPAENKKPIVGKIETVIEFSVVFLLLVLILFLSMELNELKVEFHVVVDDEIDSTNNLVSE